MISPSLCLDCNVTDRWGVCCFTNLPALVMIISVPASWNFFHSSLSWRTTLMFSMLWKRAEISIRLNAKQITSSPQPFRNRYNKIFTYKHTAEQYIKWSALYVKLKIHSRFFVLTERFIKVQLMKIWPLILLVWYTL